MTGSTGPVTWEMLNAYVDGELEPQAAAGVAAALAVDRGLAARVATLTALRATVVRLPQPDAPPLPNFDKPKDIRAKILFSALAASLLVAAAFGAAAWREQSREDIAAIPDAAVATYGDWLENDQGSITAKPIDAAFLTRARRDVPDLSSANLHLAYYSTDARKNSAFAGYVGPHGCHLGLWIERGASIDLAHLQDRPGHDLVHVWTSNGAAYALVSRGMSVERFRRLVDIVAALIGQDAPASGAQIVALREASHIGSTCRI